MVCHSLLLCSHAHHINLFLGSGNSQLSCSHVLYSVQLLSPATLSIYVYTAFQIIMQITFFSDIFISSLLEYNLNVPEQISQW